MYCKHCGAALEHDAVFCEMCGNKVEPAAAASPAAALPEGKKRGHVRLIVIEIMILAALGFGCFRYINYVNDPRAVLNSYWEAVVEGDWERAYTYADIPDAPLLGKHQFEQAVKMEGLDKVKNFRIIESESSAVNSGDMYTGMKRYQVEYVKTGSNQTYTETALVVHGNKKRFWVFEDWKVVPDSLMQQNMVINAPAYAEVRLNGKTMAELDASGKTEHGMQRYTIPYVFAGVYTLELKSDGLEPYSQDIEVDQRHTEFSMKQGYFSEAVFKELAGKAADHMEQEAQEDLRNEHAGTGSGIRFRLSEGAYYKSGHFDNYRAQLVDYGYEGNSCYARIRLSWDYHLVYMYPERGWRSSSITYTERNSQGSETRDFYYLYENGEWKQSDNK